MRSALWSPTKPGSPTSSRRGSSTSGAHGVKLLSNFAASPYPIDTPNAPTRCGKVQKHEAVQSRELAAVQDREETTCRVGVEVTDRGQPGKNEGYRSGEEADHKESAANQFENASRTAQRHWRCVVHRAHWKI